MKRILYILIGLLCHMTMVQAQSDRQLIREGNRLYRSGKYAQAETAYRKAVSKNQQNARAVYNQTLWQKIPLSPHLLFPTSTKSMPIQD